MLQRLAQRRQSCAVTLSVFRHLESAMKAHSLRIALFGRFKMKLATSIALLPAAIVIASSLSLADAAQPVALQPAGSATANAPVVLARAKAKYTDGSFTGGSFDAYYGRVQVQVNIQGGQIVSVDVLDYPRHSGTSKSINRTALPILESAVIRAQSTRVNNVSGASLTTDAYLRSLKGALKQAGA
jgi:uncharacterized protein with FMN-binding domain